MDPDTKTSSEKTGDEDTEKLQDNRQLSGDAELEEEINESEPKTLIMELYPWMQEFKKMCRSSLSQLSMTSLKNLMMYYTRNVRLSVNDSYTKPLRAEKLKVSMSETLLFFVYYYREIGENRDRASYMDLMTDILSMYIDMELKASRRGREHSSKIAARLSSSLHVFLEHSAEHLLNTLIKVHFMNHNYHEILDPVITKIFKGIQEHPNSSIMYVRYFLAYRLWKKLNKNVAVRNQINVSALASLGTAPNDIPPFIVESVLPKVPKSSQKLSTRSLLLQKFDVDKCCEEFIKFCKRDRETNASKEEQRTCLANTESLSVNQSEDNGERVSDIHNNIFNISSESQVKSLSPDSLIRESIALNNTVTTASSPLKKLCKTKKSNDIVFIDLTSDNITEKIIRRKKTRRKLDWLQQAIKRSVTRGVSRRSDSAAEDAAAAISSIEDTLDLDSLWIDSPRREEDSAMEEIIAEDTFPKDQTTIEDEPPPGAEIGEVTTTDRPESPTTNPLDNTEEQCDRNDGDEPMPLDSTKNSTSSKITEEKRTEDPEAASSNVSKSSTTESEPTASASVDIDETDEFSNAKKISDRRESSPCEVANLGESESRTSENLENSKILETRAKPLDLAIKAEHVSDESCLVTNEEIISNSVQLPAEVTDSRVPLEINCSEEVVERPVESSTKIRESEFQDNIDGLTLLASVSQRVSHLTMTADSTRSHPINGELIKVKNYASLVNSIALDEALPSNFRSVSSTVTDMVNRVIGIYPEDAMGKVAYQVELASTNDIDHYENTCEKPMNSVVVFPPKSEDSCCNGQQQLASSVSIESAAQAEKDETNVIFNGETVMLLQKAPNSNLYIINKAVENKEHVNDDVSGGIRDIAEHAGENGAFAYEFPYESIYRNQSSIPYDLTQYARDISAQESVRSKKVAAGGDTAGEVNNKPSDPMDLAKPGKNAGLPLDLVAKSVTGERKSSSNSAVNRRRHIKHEYNGCSGDLPNHITPTYGIQECPQDHVEATRSSIHIPVTHSNSLPSIYTTYTGTAELYLPCHKNCSSMACGLPVNSKGSNGGKTHCSCLSCGYGIVTHCGDCILPNSETRTSAIDSSSYYLPVHSTVQPSAVEDCDGQNSLVKMYDDKLVYKLEPSMLNGKPLESVDVRCEQKEIYRAKLDNKLPLKKRFKAMMSVSYEEMSIKYEKEQSYPGTPMLSIAAIDSRDSLGAEGSVNGNDSLDLTTVQEQDATHLANEIIRRDYRKDTTITPPSSTMPNGYHSRNGTNIAAITSCAGGGGERKRKRAQSPDVAAAKSSTRQTRSSKRNIPKVTYSYADGDSDWNPSGNKYKRRRKKTSR